MYIIQSCTVGAIDYAGGIVVHVTAGFSALVASIILGRRTGLGDITALTIHI